MLVRIVCLVLALRPQEAINDLLVHGVDRRQPDAVTPTPLCCSSVSTFP